jgi:hypothetical protein
VAHGDLSLTVGFLHGSLHLDWLLVGRNEQNQFLVRCSRDLKMLRMLTNRVLYGEPELPASPSESRRIEARRDRTVEAVQQLAEALCARDDLHIVLVWHVPGCNWIGFDVSQHAGDGRSSLAWFQKHVLGVEESVDSRERQPGACS